MGKATSKFRIEGEPLDAVQAIAKLEKKVEGLEGKLGRANRKSGDLGKSLGKIGGFAAGFFTVSAAVGFIGDALARADQRAFDAAQSVEGLTASTKKLVQISTTLDELNRKREVARGIGRKTGLKEDPAQQLVFTGLSAGLTEKEIINLSALRAVEENVPAVVEAVADIRAAFGLEAGSSRDIVNILGTAAGKAKVGLAEIAGVALSPAKLGLALGGETPDKQKTLDEALAFLSVATFGTKSPEEASVQVGAFLDLLSRDKRFQELGVFGSIEKFVALPFAQQRKIVGERRNPKLGATIVRESFGEIKSVFAEIQEQRELGKTGQGFFGQKLRIASEDPDLVRQLTLEISQEIRAQAERKFLAPQEQLEQTVKNLVLAKAAEKGFGAFRVLAIEEAFDKVLDRLDPSVQTLISMGAEFLAPDTGSAGASRVGGFTDTQREARREHLRATGFLNENLALIKALDRNTAATNGNSGAMEGQRRQGPTVPAGNSEGT